MEQKIITDLDEYKNMIEGYVTGFIAECRPMQNEDATVKAIKELAENRWLRADFVFQDETEAHFNHDVKLECQKRLTH